jgi:hypothetical protein
MDKEIREGLGLIPGKAREHWRLSKDTSVTESEEQPNQGDQSFLAWKEEMAKGVRAPSWTYPEWVLPERNLSEKPAEEAE